MTSAHDASLEARVVELETRLAFQEHAMTELSDALAELRIEPRAAPTCCAACWKT